MPITILMPALSPTMTEGNLIKWHKKEGDTVKAGDVIAEIETDKATMEVEAVDEGTLGRILVSEGSEAVAVNTPIALLLEEGEDPKSLEATAPPKTPKKEAAPAPEPASVSTLPQKESPAPTKAANAGERIFASPLARRLAEHANVDLHMISGTGPHGRIVKMDIDSASKGPKPSKSQVFGDAAFFDIPLTNVKKVTAKRLTESKQQVPHFYLTLDCTLDKLLALRSDLNARLEGQKLSVNDFIIRACALALIKVPEANVSWQGTSLRQYQAADVSVAVATDTGLITPIIRAAEAKSLTELSEEMRSLAEKAKSGKLTPQEFQGGTFTISNLGMFGIKQFEAIINPPQACILAVGMGEKRTIVKEDQIQIATQMTCTLSVDHRAVDGAIGARFLAAFQEFIQDPLRLLI